MSQTQSFKNQFLISLPSLKGDYFQNTVSLLLDHNEQGAFGLIVNQPLDNDISDIFPELKGCFQCPLMEGGPVEQDRIFFLHPTGQLYESTLEVSDEVSLTTSLDFVESMRTGNAPEKTIACLGYSGWGAEQLERELAENVWLLAPASGHIVFEVPYSQRATEAAKLLGVDLNLISPEVGHD